jgi:hypothetical protein
VLYEGIAIKLMGFMRSTNHNNPTTPKGDKKQRSQRYGCNPPENGLRHANDLGAK